MSSLRRQDSAISASSGASGVSDLSSAAGSQAGGGDGFDGSADFAESASVAQKKLNGFLVTLYKERWEDSKRFMIGRVLLEHLQLLLILLQPQFLWTFDTSYWLYDILNYSLLKNVTLPRGYAAYSAVLYILVAVTWLSLAACGYVGWRFHMNGIVPNKWPLKLLRLVVAVFCKVFYVTVLNYLLGPINCSWLVPGSTHRNVDFPGHDCMAMPHLAVIAICGVTAVVFIAAHGILAIAELTPNPLSKKWLAVAHSEVELKTWVFKTAIVVAANVLVGNGQVQSIVVLIAAGWIVYVHIRYQPYLVAWMNHFRTGAYGMAAHTALLLTINMYAAAEAQLAGYSEQDLATVQEERSAQLTLFMLVLLPAALVVGVVLSWLRLYVWVRPVLRKFRVLDWSAEGMQLGLKDVHKFVDEYEVELVARCCRQWDDYEDNIINPEAVELASMIIKCGCARFPTSVHMVLVYINFLSSVQDNQQAANSQLQLARKLHANWTDRYVLYVREQQQLTQMQANAGQGSISGVDLVGYVEFQRSFKAVLTKHRKALYAIRAFWKQLLHQQVSFRGITAAFDKIEERKLLADRAYQILLERYPANTKVMRAYARFVEGVCNDPWQATKYFADADRLEEADIAEATDIPGDDSQDRDIKSSAVAVINATGIIQMVNKPLLKMFGYKKGEAEGKNVSILMPQPFSGRHNGYLRSYLATGKAKILDQTKEVVALHQERYVFPCTIQVSKVSGSGADAVFMGVLKPMPAVPDVVQAWIVPAGGAILCVDVQFADWFGLSPAECLGRAFSSLAVDPDIFSALLERADQASMDELEAGMVEARDVVLSHKYAKPLHVDITIQPAGTEAERLYKALFKRRAGNNSEHLMVTDKRGRIVYMTTKLANLLGYEHPKQLIKTEFTKFLAQPFMQLHSRWMRDMTNKVPLSSCRNGTPVVLITQHRTPVACKIEVSSKEVGVTEDSLFIVKVFPTGFKDALINRRVSMRVDAHGNIESVGDTPGHVFGFRPQSLLGRNLSEVLDVFEGLPCSGDAQGLDMECVMTELVHACIAQKESSWRCGMHPPMTPDEVAAAKANVVQANMLDSQTKPALLQLEVELSNNDEHSIAGILVHVWRAEMLTGVVEVDRDQVITKAGCCLLHQPGLIMGIPSSAMVGTPLSRWLSVPPTYDGLLLDARKKGGALKRRAADIKIGPLLHVSGKHYDGDQVKVAVQACVKEGTGGSGLLTVKLTVEKAAKGNPNFARHLLGLPELSGTTAGQCDAVLATLGRLMGLTIGAESSPGTNPAATGSSKQLPPKAADTKALESKSLKARGGVHFGGGGGSDGEEEGRDDDDKDEDGPPVKAKSAKNDRLMEWVQTQSVVNSDDGQLEAEESMATTHLQLPIDKLSKGDEDASQAEGSESGGYQSDFKRGRRLHKLARMLNSRPAQKFATSFYANTMVVVLLLLAAHLGCFVASVVLLDAQKQYIDEVDDAGVACIAMHRLAIDCRVLDAISRGITHPGIFEASELPYFQELMEEAIQQFEKAHEDTYLGRPGMLRRLFNRQKYQLADYWESPYWPAKVLLNTTPPVVETRNMSLWQMGNRVVLSSREVNHNLERMLADGQHLDENPFWHFVMQNAPEALYQGYKLSLYGLVERAAAKIAEVRQVMVILLVIEGCGLFLAATIYVCYLVRKMVNQRAELFSVFLVIPTGFLRALASKQVQLDEDEGSDADSDFGGEGEPAPPPPPAQETQKLNLNLGTKRGSKVKQGSGSGQPDTLVGRLGKALNPVSWFKYKTSIDTGKRTLLHNSPDMWKVGVPIFLWGVVVIIVYATSMQQLDQVHGPFQMLNIINFLVFRVTRSVLFSLEAVLGPTPALKMLRQAQVAQRLENTRQEYVSFLYGFDAVGISHITKNPAVPTDLSTAEAALFKTTDLAHVFFRTKDCLREDQSSCYPEGHRFYTVTHSGLDAMANRFMQEGSELVLDAPGNINISDPRFEYIWQVGRADLFNGMTAADLVFRSSVDGMFDAMRVAHVEVFVLSLVAAFFIWLGLARPMLKASGKESRAIAEMLSQLPDEIDVEALVTQAVARTGADDEATAGVGGAGGASGGRQQLGAGAGSSSGRGSGPSPRRAAGNSSGSYFRGSRRQQQQAQ